MFSVLCGFQRAVDRGPTRGGRLISRLETAKIALRMTQTELCHLVLAARCCQLIAQLRSYGGDSATRRGDRKPSELGFGIRERSLVILCLCAPRFKRQLAKRIWRRTPVPVARGHSCGCALPINVSVPSDRKGPRTESGNRTWRWCWRSGPGSDSVAPVRVRRSS